MDIIEIWTCAYNATRLTSKMPMASAFDFCTTHIGDNKIALLTGLKVTLYETPNLRFKLNVPFPGCEYELFPCTYSCLCTYVVISYIRRKGLNKGPYTWSKRDTNM